MVQPPIGTRGNLIESYEECNKKDPTAKDSDLRWSGFSVTEVAGYI